MNREKTHLYKKQHQQPIEEETPPHKGKSKMAATSDSRKRSKHKHLYKKIILHYGSDSFAWGRQCEICGRVDSTYKSSYWNPKEFQVTGEGSLHANGTAKKPSSSTSKELQLQERTLIIIAALFASMIRPSPAPAYASIASRSRTIFPSR